jgi:uncharacterized small protein (DUF1192 family)
MVRSDGRGYGGQTLLVALEILARRVARLEDEIRRLTRERARLSSAAGNGAIECVSESLPTGRCLLGV